MDVTWMLMIAEVMPMLKQGIDQSQNPTHSDWAMQMHTGSLLSGSPWTNSVSGTNKLTLSKSGNSMSEVELCDPDDFILIWMMIIPVPWTNKSYVMGIWIFRKHIFYFISMMWRNTVYIFYPLVPRLKIWLYIYIIVVNMLLPCLWNVGFSCLILKTQ